MTPARRALLVAAFVVAIACGAHPAACYDVEASAAANADPDGDDYSQAELCSSTAAAAAPASSRPSPLFTFNDTYTLPGDLR